MNEKISINSFFENKKNIEREAEGSRKSEIECLTQEGNKKDAKTLARILNSIQNQENDDQQRYLEKLSSPEPISCNSY